MSSGFHNFNSNIVNQVIGTLSIGSRETESDFIQKQLDTIQEQLNAEAASSNADVKSAILAVDEIRRELASKSPKADILDRSLRTIDGISSVASLIGQIRALLSGVV